MAFMHLPLQLHLRLMGVWLADKRSLLASLRRYSWSILSENANDRTPLDWKPSKTSAVRGCKSYSNSSISVYPLLSANLRPKEKRITTISALLMVHFWLPRGDAHVFFKSGMLSFVMKFELQSESIHRLQAAILISCIHASASVFVLAARLPLELGDGGSLVLLLTITGILGLPHLQLPIFLFPPAVSVSHPGWSHPHSELYTLSFSNSKLLKEPCR